MPLGHEYAGTVVEVGADVTGFKIGDRVAYNSNNSPADMGRGGEFGGFSDYVLLRDVDGHPQSLCRVPDEVSLEHAALVEPLAVAAHAVNRANPSRGESVTLFGAGPIGLGIVVALKERGVEDLVVFDLSPLRRERALRLGADAAYDPREHEPKAILGERRGHGLIWGMPYPRTDIYIEASGAPGMIADIIDFADKRSRIVTVAMQRHPVTIDGTRLMSKELTLLGASGYPSEFPEVMDKLAKGLVDPEAMISHRFAFSDFMTAFETADDPGSAAKVLLTFD